MQPRVNLPVVTGGSPPAPALPASYADDAAGPGMSKAQMLSILRAHWKLSAVLVLVLLAVSAAGIKLMPRKYVATATLLVNMDDKDPLAGRDQNGMSPSYIPTQIELMTSRIVLRPVVQKLGLENDSEFAAHFQGSSDAELEAVVRNLENAVQVVPGSGSQLLYVSVTSKHSVTAANIANAIADEYLAQARARTSGPASERARRYTQELAELRSKVIAAQDRVTAFRKQHELPDIEAEKGDVEAAALTSLEQKLLVAQNERRELEARLRNERSPDDQALNSMAVQTMRAKLAAEEAELAELRTTLGPRHPRVLELQSQIAATRHSLEGQVQAISTNAADELASARQLAAEYQRAVDAQRTKVVQRRSLQDEGAKLLLELDSAQATYKRALDGYDQIVFASAAQFNDVQLISRADPPVKAAKPSKMKLMLMASVAALGIGIGGPFVYELLINRRLRCRDDLERAFGIPVLVQLGPLPVIRG